MGAEGIILAAGYSSRAGVNKLLLDLRGRSVLERCIESMSPFCTRIIIVGGHRIEELQAVLTTSSCLEIVFNPSFSQGMFSSVQKGISQVREEKFFLCPGDYPLIKKQTYMELLSAQGPIAVPTYQGRPGHPVLIAGSFIRDILGGGYSCLRDFIKVNNPQFIDTMDPGIHIDIDTLEDYQNIVMRIGGEADGQYLG